MSHFTVQSPTVKGCNHFHQRLYLVTNGLRRLFSHDISNIRLLHRNQELSEYPTHREHEWDSVGSDYTIRWGRYQIPDKVSHYPLFLLSPFSPFICSISRYPPTMPPFSPSTRHIVLPTDKPVLIHQSTFHFTFQLQYKLNF